MMADSELVKRLLTEERLRQEIRSTLEKEQKKSPTLGSRLWSFLNSTFGLFLLSSVIIAGLGRLYGDYSQGQHEEDARRLEIAKLSTEIDYRTSELELLTKQLARGDLSDKEREANGIYVWRIVTGDVMFHPAWPDFKELHLYGVMLRLKLVGHVPISNEIFRAILEIENGRDKNWNYKREDLERYTRTIQEYRKGLLASRN